MRLGLDKVRRRYILPENMVWWRCDAAGRYIECLVREYQDPSDRVDYDKNGNAIDPEDTGQVGEAVAAELRPLPALAVRRVDPVQLRRRQDPRAGPAQVRPRADRPADRPQEAPDADHRQEPVRGDRRAPARVSTTATSELILSDTLQAHPFLSGAEDFCKADNTLSVGPGYVLPMKKNPESGAYQGWEFVSPPKDPAESLRKNKEDMVDMKDRRACLTKPAGVAGGRRRRPSSQSGSPSSSTPTPGTSCWSRSPSRWRRPSGSSPSMRCWCFAATPLDASGSGADPGRSTRPGSS